MKLSFCDSFNGASWTQQFVNLLHTVCDCNVCPGGVNINKDKGGNHNYHNTPLLSHRNIALIMMPSWQH